MSKTTRKITVPADACMKQSLRTVRMVNPLAELHAMTDNEGRRFIIVSSRKA